MQFSDEFCVLIGHPKGIMVNMESARDYLSDIRRLGSAGRVLTEHDLEGRSSSRGPEKAC